jgi:hypothetical protein
MFEVEKGIPCPVLPHHTAPSKVWPKFDYPFDKLKPGQSFFIPLPDWPDMTAAEASMITAHANRKNTNKRFSYRRRHAQHDGEEGFRFWRIDKGNETDNKKANKTFPIDDEPAYNEEVARRWKGQPRTLLPFPFSKMEPGDSFFVSKHAIKGLRADTISTRVSNINTKPAKKTTAVTPVYCYRTRLPHIDGEEGYRIWRVK